MRNRWTFNLSAMAEGTRKEKEEWIIVKEIMPESPRIYDRHELPDLGSH